MRVALCQIVITDSIKNNYMKMMYCTRYAKRNGCDLIIFPESCLTGYLGISLSSLEQIGMRGVFKYLDKLSILARNERISIVSGQYMMRCGKWYNNVIFFGKDGECKGSYDKEHLIDDDCYYITPGNGSPLFSYDNVKYILGICHDIRYAEHAM